MLRISKKADYAIFLLGAIARQGAYPGGSAADSVVSAQEISTLAGLNKSVVANLLKEFSRHGVLDSVRGLRGGYRLTSPPSAVSLGQILEVVEGKFALVDCVPQFAASASGGNSNDERAGDDRPANNRPASDRAEATGGHDCSLSSFCPSKQPMRIVHDRISRLFNEIYLDELCSMTPFESDSTQDPNASAGCCAPSPLEAAINPNPRGN